MRASKSWMPMARWASASVISAAVLVGAGTTPASAQSPAISISPTSGPVGTVVTLHGNAGPGCGAGSFPTLEFGQGATGPVEFIVVPVASNGAWSATFVIPPFVGALATRGGFGGDVGPGTWQFDAPLCAGHLGPASTAPFEVTGTLALQPASRVVGMSATVDGKGYWLAQSGGGVLSYGDARFHGSLPTGVGGSPVVPAEPISAIAAAPDGGGYWLAGQDGGVYAFGSARFYGSLPSVHLAPSGVVVGITPTRDGHGYWLLGADGGVFSFGDARFFGSPRPEALAMTTLVTTTSGKGYLTVPANGDAPLANGDAVVPARRSAGPMTMDALVTGAAMTTDGKGLWEVGTDGEVFALGTAHLYGSLPAIGATPVAPVVGMATTPGSGGYWLVAADGGVFTFGNAGFYGSAAGLRMRW